MNVEELGRRIRERRERRGLKQTDVANALQVSAQAVSKWERGENAPDISLLLRLSAILGVSVDWLLADHPKEKDVFEATVLVSSVLGYAKKSQELPLPELAIWANSLLFMLTETVLKHDGIPVKQLGDGLLCFFSGNDHQSRAIEASRKAVRLANEPLKIALASGEIYLGTIGHPDYSQLDVLGSAVNTAFCLLGWMGGMTRSGIFMPNDMADSCPEKEWLLEPEFAELSAIRKRVEVVEIR